ncbi:hypothetical protein EGW08_014559 [Elysia chlorotica]|uniref:Uncharacterized protein n=1 Tax=Elysia chlorotica TaxID=188477 RepID=A0A3S0ZHD2_ELYCH|nr:hypothetical protein EGW08_014559 [Elysia chlorotica]
MAAQIIQIRSWESFVHRFHGDVGPREVEICEEEIRHAWADEPSITEAQKVALVRKYLGCSVKDELACYPAKFTAEPEAFSVGDKVFLTQHLHRRKKSQPRYTVVSTPKTGDTYVVRDDASQQTRVVTASEMCLYLARTTADVCVDPAVDVGSDQAVDVGVDPTAGEPEDRTADVGVDPAVQTGADGTARVGVGLTVDEAAHGDVAAEGDVEPATVKPTQSGLGDDNPRGEMTYLVQIEGSRRMSLYSEGIQRCQSIPYTNKKNQQHLQQRSICNDIYDG